MKNGDGCWQTVKGTKWYKCIITTDELMITNAVDEWYTIKYSLFTAYHVTIPTVLVWIHC